MGTIFDDLMRNPLLVIKSGNATGTTAIGRANGVFFIVRDYFNDMSINQTSMEWRIINYDNKSEAFPEPGGSGSAIANTRVRISGVFTGGSGGSSSVSRPTGSPTRSSTSSPRHLNIDNGIDDHFCCDFSSFFYTPLSVGRLLVQTSAWTGGSLFRFVFIFRLVFSYLQLTTLTSRPWTSGLVV
jgi:hypothetical protein